MEVKGPKPEDRRRGEFLNRVLLAHGIATVITVDGEEASILIHGRDTGTALRRIMNELGYGLHDVILVHPFSVRSDRPRRAYAACSFRKGRPDIEPSRDARPFNDWMMSPMFTKKRPALAGRSRLVLPSP